MPQNIDSKSLNVLFQTCLVMPSSKRAANKLQFALRYPPDADKAISGSLLAYFIYLKR